MYVVAQHEIKDAPSAFQRGQSLIKGEGAPEGVRVLQFYPSRDQSTVTCLWEGGSIDAVQNYVDATLADASINTCYEVDAEHGFSDRPLGMAASPAALAQ